VAHTTEELRQILVDVLLEVVPGLPEADVKPDASLTGSLGLASVSVVRMAIELDRALGKPIPVLAWLNVQVQQGTDTLQHMAEWIASGAEAPKA